MSVCLIAGAFFMQKKQKGYWMEVNKEPVTKEDLKKNGYKEQAFFHSASQNNQKILE